jgi:hypothetical protein
MKDVGKQWIDWHNCAIGALDRSYWTIRPTQMLPVFEDGR